MRVLHDDKGYTVLELTAEYKCGYEQSISVLTIEMRKFRNTPKLDDVKISRLSNMRKPKVLVMSREEALAFAHAMLHDEERRQEASHE